MKVGVKVINSSANPLPKYMTEGAVAVDLYSAEVVELHPHTTTVVSTGLKVAIPDGYELQIRSRSGLAAKNSIFVCNGVGTVDQDFRGVVGVILHNLGNTVFDIRVGDRIAQAVLAPVTRLVWEEVTELDATDRGDGGFGSSGISSEIPL